MAEIKTLLDDVIKTEISNLRTLPSGDEKRGAAIRELASLHKLRIEEIRAQADVDEKAERRKMDSKQQEAELAAKDVDQNRENEAQIFTLARPVDGRLTRWSTSMKVETPWNSCKMKEAMTTWSSGMICCLPVAECAEDPTPTAKCRAECSMTKHY